MRNAHCHFDTKKTFSKIVLSCPANKNHGVISTCRLYVYPTGGTGINYEGVRVHCIEELLLRTEDVKYFLANTARAGPDFILVRPETGSKVHRTVWSSVSRLLAEVEGGLRLALPAWLTADSLRVMQFAGLPLEQSQPSQPPSPVLTLTKLFVLLFIHHLEWMSIEYWVEIFLEILFSYYRYNYKELPAKTCLSPTVLSSFWPGLQESVSV